MCNLVLDTDQEWCQTLATLVARYEVSCNTIQTYIRGFGFGNRIAVRKPYLNSTHKAARLAFAHKFVHWIAEDWYKVIWTDELSLELGNNSDRFEFGAKFMKNTQKTV